MSRYPTKNRDSLDVRLWQRVDKTDYCWNWTGKFSEKGYGAMRYHGRRILVHRAAWELANGPIPPDLCVLHRCDNPACVRPDHLWLGTRTDNNKDMTAKGRHAHVGVPSEKCHTCKLTIAQVREIRAIYATPEKHPSFAEVAKRFGVHATNIGNIIAFRTWKHVTP
jgi:hypothetical protein